ncbi:MAG: helix-turn-helix domain-containing protein [Cyanobacteria bacterium REEB444]|nr:helix-turn-helix domain-containing protein [Cyanobacteria bacterium REEB444]
MSTTQKAFKYRFYPTSEQEILLRRTIGCARCSY